MKAFFQCDHCLEKFDREAFSAAVDQYGLILLRGARDGFYGTLCPRCKKTSLTRRSKNFLKKHILELIVTQEEDGRTYILHYESFPYSQKHHNKAIPGRFRTVDLHGPKGSFGANLCIDDDSDIGGGLILSTPGEYSSCQTTDMAVGPLMTVCWFKADSIPDLVRIENETGLKVFPRYILAERFCGNLKRFCYRNYLELELAKEHLIEDYIYSSRSGENPWKRRIGENYELLNMLCAPPPRDKSFTSIKGKDLPLDVEITSVFGEEDNPYVEDGPGFFFFIPDPEPRDRPSEERMGETIWPRFNEEYVQDLLTGMSSRLIHRFIELSTHVDFFPKMAWNLKTEALDDLYRAIISPEISISLRRDLRAEELKEIEEAEASFPGVRIISNDPKINRIKIDMSKMASVEKKDVSFLLLGESGTGKELFAKAIHEASGRKGRYIISDCGAKSDDLFESQLFGHVKGAFTSAIRDKKGDFELAKGGTIFLDEIGNLSPALQPKMLRVLREREIQPLGAEYTKKVDVKIVLATNKDLAKMVEDGRFMPDLYQRFKRPQFLIPPLRERKNDVPGLVQHLLEKHDVERENDPSMAPIKVTPECMRALTRHEWKGGNIGELEKVIEEIMIRRAGSKDRRDISKSDLPREIIETEGQQNELGEDQRNEKLPGNQKVTDDQIKNCMAKLKNNKSRVARELGVTYKTINLRCKRITS